MNGELGIVCLGEALVDLICPDRVRDPVEARRFEAHFGGALANVAVAARRAGAPAALAGGCGTDEWGRFLRARLRDEDISLELLAELDDVPTPFAFVTLDERGEPAFRIHGEGIEEGIASLAGREKGIVRGATAIVVGSNTLPDEPSRAVTQAVCAAASRADVPLLLDPNLRPGRWAELERARELCLEVAREATVLKCNLDEARWLSGNASGDAAASAEALCELGPELVVVTAGSAPAVARGACSVAVTSPATEIVCPLGAGDSFMGTLAAGLDARGWRLEEAQVPMERAAAAAAGACTRLGAVD